jgi:starvation-inducible DNA-binding protein
MENVAYLGLKTETIEDLSEKLNELLANYQVFYMNLRGFHWNIKGEKFFELHNKFEDLYNDAAKKIDEVAERIKTLGFTPVHSFTDYIEITSIKERRNVSDGTRCVESILDSISYLLEVERDILQISAESGDEGTNNLMSDFIKDHEKLVWMFNAFLGGK